MVPIPERPSIRRALSSQGRSASVNIRTPPEAADGTACSATPTRCVAPLWNQTVLTAKPVAFRSCPQATRPHRQRVGRMPLCLVLPLLLARVRLRRQNGKECHANSCRPCPCEHCRLTLPSRGCPKGCAFRSPLMSNVGRHKSARGAAKGRPAILPP